MGDRVCSQMGDQKSVLTYVAIPEIPPPNRACCLIVSHGVGSFGKEPRYPDGPGVAPNSSGW